MECFKRRIVYLQLLPLVLVGLLSSGCVFTHGKLDFSDYLSLADKQQTAVVEELAGDAARIQGFRALIRGTVTNGIAQQSFQQAIVFQRPDLFRADLFATNLNQLLALVVFKRGQILAYDKKKNEIFVGTVNKKNIGKLLSIPFSLNELMLWITGRFPIETQDGNKRPAVWISPDKLQTAVEYRRKEGGTIRAVLSRLSNALVVKSLEVLDSGGREQLLFSEFEYPPIDQNLNKQVFPVSAKITIPKRNIKLSLTYDGSKLNPELKDIDQIFGFAVPAGISVRDLDRDSEGLGAMPLGMAE